MLLAFLGGFFGLALQWFGVIMALSGFTQPDHQAAFYITGLVIWIFGSFLRYLRRNTVRVVR